MGQRRLVVQADLLVQLSMDSDGGPRSFTVTNPLPDDVEIVRYQQQPSRYGAMSSSVLWVVLESASWQGDELGAGQELEAVSFTVHYEGEFDEQEETTELPNLKAALVKAKLIQERKVGQVLGRGSEPEPDEQSGPEADGPNPAPEEPEGAEEPENEPDPTVLTGQTGPRGARAAARVSR